MLFHSQCCCAGADCGDQHGGNLLLFHGTQSRTTSDSVYTSKHVDNIYMSQFLWKQSMAQTKPDKMSGQISPMCCISDHLHCSLGHPWAACRAACRAALSPGGFCSLELHKDTDETAPGMLCVQEVQEETTQNNELQLFVIPGWHGCPKMRSGQSNLLVRDTVLALDELYSTCIPSTVQPIWVYCIIVFAALQRRYMHSLGQVPVSEFL